MIAVNSRCSIGYGYSLLGRNLLASVRSIRFALPSVLFSEIAELCNYLRVKTTIPLFCALYITKLRNYSCKLSQIDLI